MTVFAAGLMLFGVAFLLIAAIGIIRLPDALQRMHSATKAGTLGTALLLLGVALSGTVEAGFTVGLTISFLLATLPIGAQLLARATYVAGTPLEGLDTDPLETELERDKVPPAL